MADPHVAAAAKEVRDAKAELQDAEQNIARVELEAFEANRRWELAQLRVQEAERVLLEMASQ